MTVRPRLTHRCVACNSEQLTDVVYWTDVPVHCSRLYDDPAVAVRAPRGDLRLVFCADCGLLSNPAFDPARVDYDLQYEESQGFSAHFRDYSRSLAKRWVERYRLHGLTVVEIGCGSGAEFLVDLLECGVGHGVGADPGLDVARVPDEHGDKLSLSSGCFPEDLPVLDAAAVVCRHTLEHIAGVRDFMSQVRTAIGSRADTVVLFEVPDTLRVLRESAFWDVYYEHCSYFSAGSLGGLFRATGFDVLDISLDYDDQYLLIEARPAADAGSSASLPIEDDRHLLGHGIQTFTTGYRTVVRHWSDRLADVTARGGRAVIWGAGSKAVGFLGALGDRATLVAAAVDVNPHKHGKYLPGTGHRVVSPDELADHPPELVIVMNAVYRDEIAAELHRRSIATILEVL